MSDDRSAPTTLLVTGASCPMGLALVRYLAAQPDTTVIACYHRNPRPLRDMGIEHPNIHAMSVDLRRDDATEEVASLVSSLPGPLAGIVHLAGILDLGLFEDLDRGRYREVLAVNVEGFTFLVQRLLPMLADGASIVAVASTDSQFGSPASPAYAASKAALISICRSLACALGPRGIRVNALSPGHVEGGTSTLVGDRADLRALERRGDPDDIAGVIGFLLSPAASYMTGGHVVVDGGASIVEQIARDDWLDCRRRER